MIKNNKCDNITVHQISDLSKIFLTKSRKPRKRIANIRLTNQRF